MTREALATAARDAYLATPKTRGMDRLEGWREAVDAVIPYLSKGHTHDDPNWHMSCPACNGKAEGEDDYQGDNGPTLADAWDEGHSAGEMDRHAPPNKYPTPNPYRTGATP